MNCFIMALQYVDSMVFSGMKTNSAATGHRSLGQWLVGFMDRAIAARLDRLEQQVQTYQQDNQALQEKLRTDQDQIQQLTEQVARLERCIQAAEPTGSNLQQVDRQLSRIWQYYQDAKVQFEQINRQLKQQRTTSEETSQKFRQQLTAMGDRQRVELRDLKQQLDQLIFSGRAKPLASEQLTDTPPRTE